MRAILLPVVLALFLPAPAFPKLIQTNSKPVSSSTVQTQVDCACDEPLPEVLATVNGVKIQRQDLTGIQQRIDELHSQVVEARKAELNLQINSQLLESEAKKRASPPANCLNGR